MLQQTQVERVREYFTRFMLRFPTVHALAEATAGDVLKLWEGLGYYGRARLMHRAARVLVDENGGEIPTTRDELAKLPGFGPYTAAAVASIAFGERVPAVDTNVRRVVSRLACIEGTASDTANRPSVDGAAGALVRSRRPGDVNQALMDLGSAICRSRAPRCEICPLTATCLARATGDPERWPAPRVTAERTKKRQWHAVIERRGIVFVVERPAGGLLGGMWEFPGCDVTAAADEDAAADSLAAEIKKRTGLSIDLDETIATVHLTFSHLEIDATVVRAHPVDGRTRRGAGRWVSIAGCDDLPLTRTTRAALNALASKRC